MRRVPAWLLAVAVALTGWACGGGAAEKAGGDATVTIGTRSFEVANVKLIHELGEDGYFRFDGEDAAHPHDDCVPGLGGGLALYGEMPPTATSLEDLIGRDLPFEFTGDGDDANLCFVGSNGLLGVETGTVRIKAVDGTRVTFTFTGSFVLYDGQGGRAPAEVVATGRGVARAVTY